MSTLLFLDSDLLVLSKDPGEAVATNRNDQQTVVEEWRRYTTDSRLQPLHRIDQPVGGIVVLGRGKEALSEGYRQFREGTVYRRYVAIVVHPPESKVGTLNDKLLYDSKRNKSHIDPRGKTSVLRYRTIGTTDHHTVLEVDLDTGRHHQIRAQLAAIGSTILGDTRYGARRPMRDRSIGLFAWQLTIRHPRSGMALPFQAPLPAGAVWRAVASVIDPVGEDAPRSR